MNHKNIQSVMKLIFFPNLHSTKLKDSKKEICKNISSVDKICSLSTKSANLVIYMKQDMG